MRLVTYKSIPGVIQKANGTHYVHSNISILSALMIATPVSAIGYLPTPMTTRMIPKDGVSYISQNPYYLSPLQQRQPNIHGLS